MCCCCGDGKVVCVEVVSDEWWMVEWVVWCLIDRKDWEDGWLCSVLN